MKWHFAHVERITMLDLRRDARRLVERLERGESFRLTYRNRTVGELHPVVVREGAAADDPIYRIGDDAEDLGGGMDARLADNLIYGG